MRLDLLKLFVPSLAIVPRLESNEEKRVVTGANEAQQTESHDAGRVLNSGRVANDLVHLRRRLRGPFERSAVGQLEIHVREALIFIGQKARRQMLRKKSSGGAKGQQQDNH